MFLPPTARTDDGGSNYYSHFPTRNIRKNVYNCAQCSHNVTCKLAGDIVTASEIYRNHSFFYRPDLVFSELTVFKMADILHLKTLSSGSSYIPTYQVLSQSSWKFSPQKRQTHGYTQGQIIWLQYLLHVWRGDNYDRN